MQNFQTTAGKPYSFADDVIVTETGGAYSFKTAAGMPLNVPTDLTPCPNNQLPGPTPAHLWAAYQGKARVALQATDMVAIRCLKAGVAFPADWQSYVASLRAIVAAASGDPTQPLPVQPSYPAGT